MNEINYIEMIAYKIMHTPQWKCLIENCDNSKHDEKDIMLHLLFHHGLDAKKVTLDGRDGSIWLQDGIANISKEEKIN